MQFIAWMTKWESKFKLRRRLYKLEKQIEEAHAEIRRLVRENNQQEIHLGSKIEEKKDDKDQEHSTGWC